MKDRQRIKNILEKECKNRSLYVNYYEKSLLGNCSNIKNSSISIKKDISLSDLADFSHEIGHCVLYRIQKKIIRNKIYVLIIEFIAWIIGLYICLKNKTYINGFVKRCLKCLFSYIKK